MSTNRYLAIYLGSATARQKAMSAGTVTAASAASGMAAWVAWAAKHQDAIVDMGAPLGTTKRVSPDGIADTANQATAYVIVEADSHAAAAAMFVDHPHFTIFPGDSVEVMPCLPMPQS
jgi:enoyl-[acyl-carrier-protein] reductase (NADH)